MAEVSREILVILILLLANGAFALSEIAIVSSRKARLQQQAERGDAGARAALDLADDPTRFLSTVQVGITLIGIFTGAFGGASLSEELSAALKNVPALAPYRATLSLILVVMGITYFSLIIGELVPKRLGLNHPERYAALMARPMRLLSRIASPVVRLLSASTDLLLRLMGVKPAEEAPVTEEEINVLIRQGTAAGVFEAAEGEIVERVFHVGDTRVSEIMTPRVDLIALDIQDSKEENFRKLLEHHFSFYPVYRGSPDDVIGIVRSKELMPVCMTGELPDLAALAHPPLVVPESLRVLKLLERFKQTGWHAALVIDEYGGTQGLVTSTDVLESLVGEILSDEEKEDAEFIQREDGSWLVDGAASVTEFTERIGGQPDLQSFEGAYVTMGGFVMTHLGRVPASGDHFEHEGLRFEVMDMDGRRVDKVLVTPHPDGNA